MRVEQLSGKEDGQGVDGLGAGPGSILETQPVQFPQPRPQTPHARHFVPLAPFRASTSSGVGSLRLPFRRLLLCPTFRRCSRAITLGGRPLEPVGRRERTLRVWRTIDSGPGSPYDPNMSSATCRTWPLRNRDSSTNDPATAGATTPEASAPSPAASAVDSSFPAGASGPPERDGLLTRRGCQAWPGGRSGLTGRRTTFDQQSNPSVRVHLRRVQ